MALATDNTYDIRLKIAGGTSLVYPVDEMNFDGVRCAFGAWGGESTAFGTFRTADRRIVAVRFGAIDAMHFVRGAAQPAAAAGADRSVRLHFRGENEPQNLTTGHDDELYDLFSCLDGGLDAVTAVRALTNGNGEGVAVNLLRLDAIEAPLDWYEEVVRRREESESDIGGE